MMEDRYGLPVTTGSTAARDAYVAAVDGFLSAAPGVEAAFRRAIEADEGLALAHLGLARHFQSVGRAAEAQAPLAAARKAAEARPVTAREAGQLGALGALIEGRGADAFAAIRAHLADHPRDAMAAQPCMGVFGLIGFSGRAEREREQLEFTSALAPRYGEDWWFLGQHAFAQMEAGETRAAEGTIERSLAGNPRNAHGAHIRAHLHYENGETEAGLAYLDDWRADYAREGLMHCHVSWHVALWALERGEVGRMWEVVDADLEDAWGPPLNVLTDLAAILWRAELAGVEVARSRWRRVSDYAARMFPAPGIAFADAHAALAHAMAGEGAALERIAREATGPAGDVVRELAVAFGALARGDWAEAEAHLRAVADDHARLGGSRAQRDLIEFAHAAALLRLGRGAEARARLAARRPQAPARGVAGL